MDFADHGALETLEWVLGLAPTAPAALFLQLHTGDPGADGTANVATENSRQAVTFAAPANTGTDGRAQAATSADVTWTAVAADETYSHISIWDDGGVGLGSCWYKGPMAAPVPVLTGGDFTFPAGQTLDHV